MPDRDDDTDFDADDLQAPSKSARKRRMLALQDLGETLVTLSEKQLAALPVSDARLLLAIRECRTIRSHSARRRQLQFIGKLMRELDPVPIERALQDLDRQHRSASAAFHELETLRDAVLSDGLPGIEKILARWPGADRQHLRQLLLQHEREQRGGKPPAAGRKLFRYLRELQEAGAKPQG